jgi:hypothetical protein
VSDVNRLRSSACELDLGRVRIHTVGLVRGAQHGSGASVEVHLMERKKTMTSTWR